MGNRRTARKDAGVAAHNATVRTTLAPFCADPFRPHGDATARWPSSVKASTWERNSVLEKAASPPSPGSKTGDSDIARACVGLLLAPATPKT